MASDLTSRLGGARSSLAIKAPVRAATTVNIALTGEQTIDDVAVIAEDRVLVKNQTVGADNGIYICKATAWARAVDFDGTDDAVAGSRVYVTNGTTYSNTGFYLTTANPVVLGTTALTFAFAPGTGDALVSNPLSQFAATTSAQLRGVLSDDTGTGPAVFATSPTLDTPTLNSPTLVTPALGTPASGSLANCTALPVATGIAGLAAGVAAFLGTPSSANLAAALTGETGTGAAVFGTSPGFTTAANPVSNDGAALGTTALQWSDLFLASGGVVNWGNGDVTITHSSNLLASAGASSGYTFDAAVRPDTNDVAALGSASTAWSDIFLATGAVIDFGNANATLTHSSGALTANAALLSSHTTGGVGYATGSGGTVTQATSKSTGVTLNKPTGTITMNGALLANVTTVGFTLTNSCIAATDVVAVSIKSGATASSYFVQVGAVGAGSCLIEVRNYTAGNLSDTIVLSFAVIKGVAA